MFILIVISSVLSSKIHFSVIIREAHNSARATVAFFTWVRYMPIFVVNETDTELQLLSSGWSVIVASVSQNFFVIAAPPIDWLFSPFCGLFVVLNNYRFHINSILITEITIFHSECLYN